MQEVKIRLIANSGVYLIYGNLRLMIDGVFDKNPFFSPPDKEVQKAVFGMDSIYRNVDYLIHTHRHADHFCAKYINEYIANNHQTVGVFAPAPGKNPDSYLEDREVLSKVKAYEKLYEINAEFGCFDTYPLAEGCSVSYLRSEHLSEKEFMGVLHYMVIVKLGNKKIIFAADSAPKEESFLPLYQAENPDAVFVTPLFLADPRGTKILRTLSPKIGVIYHIPFAPDDATGIRGLANKQLALYKDFPVRITALTEPRRPIQC